MNLKVSSFDFEDMDGIADDDAPLSCKLNTLGSIDQTFFSPSRSGESSFMKSIDFGSIVQHNPFSTDTPSFNSDFKSGQFEIKTSSSSDFQYDNNVSTSQTSSSPVAKSILKSQRKVRFSQDGKPGSKMIPAYFINGNQDFCENWNESKWKEQQKWWGERWELKQNIYKL